jgi:hypothetical protein
MEKHTIQQYPNSKEHSKAFDPLCLTSSLALHFFPIIPFGSITLLTGMTGISLHMQWPLTSQSNANSKALIINKNLTELNPLALCCLGYLQTKCPASKH